MPVRWCFTAGLVLAAFGLRTGPAWSQEGGPIIWYRSSEGCPDGEAFVARLRGAASGARLAEVTDRIEFVVTLGRRDSRSSGKLERQTAGSTVAIREIEAESCDEVADVLALTLTLALDPTANGARQTTPVAEPATGEHTSEPAARSEMEQGQPSSQPSSRSSATEPPPVVGHERTRSTRSSPDARWLLGGQAGVVTGPTGAFGPWLGLFVELEPGLIALPSASARLTALASRVEDSEASLVFSTAAGRLEGCPVALGAPSLHVRPCVGFEFGVAVAEGLSAVGRDDSDLWFAASGLGRLTWMATPSFALSLDAGVTVPIVVYTFSSESGSNAQHADPIAFFGVLGAAVVLP